MVISVGHFIFYLFSVIVAGIYGYSIKWLENNKKL